MITLRGFWGQQLLCVRTEGPGSVTALSVRVRWGWWGVADRALSWPRRSMIDSSPGEVHREPIHSVSQWWSPPHTGRGCFPPHGSDGSEELSDLEAIWVVLLSVDSNRWLLKWNTSENFFFNESKYWPSLNSRLSSWFGQRFTTSVTCSAFL